MTATNQPRCRRCHRALGRKQIVSTKVGTFCARHGDRIAPHLRKPPRPPRKDTAS